MSRQVRHTISAVMDGHGPVEHYRLCRRLFGQERRRALYSTYCAYWRNAH
jgi:hypothetical protein